MTTAPNERPAVPPRRLPLLAVEAATLLSGTANGVTVVVLPWLVLERGGGAAGAGLVAAGTALPLVLTAVLAGVVVDRVGRRRVSVVSDVVSAAAVAAIPLLELATGGLGLGAVVALAALGALLDPAGVTAREAMLPEAAAAARLPLSRVNGVHEAVWGSAFFIGPAIGGVLIGLVGAVPALWATTGAFLLSAVVVAVVRVPGGGRPDPREETSGSAVRRVLTDTAEGIAVLRRDRLVLCSAAVAVLVSATYLPISAVLLPVLFEQQGAPGRLGLLLLVMSGGWVLGSLLQGALGHLLPRSVVLRVATVGASLALVPFVALPPYPVLLGCGALAGLLFGPINPLVNLAFQRRVPPHLRGRVLGIVASGAYAAGPVGHVAAGVLVDTTGLRTAFAVFVGAVVLAGLSALAMRPLRELDDLPDGEDVDVPVTAPPPSVTEPVLPGSREPAAR
ncbi:MFS transporter [Modestobacter sp. VKM Ac-2984]|uniref:MFS transporter n=1 Tax=Modestobacter sp. VKM Ac-2984 TaxID=3004138 RepID=UPI0022AAC5C8|nr:MFS transporter [Modestobacter sp. VKM Ac-2984]MCZ2817552.1 MFS transporter [Modestobacter sp. VKM Ac-2984]